MPDHLAPEDGEGLPGPVVDTTAPRPEPVLNAAKLAGAISGVILSVGALLKLVGVLIPNDYDLEPIADQTGNAVLAIGTAWALIGPWITARIRARDKVTPLEDPQTAAGVPLVPVGKHEG